MRTDEEGLEEDSYKKRISDKLIAMCLCNSEVSLAFKIIQKKSKWHDMTIQFKLSPTLINIHLFS